MYKATDWLQSTDLYIKYLNALDNTVMYLAIDIY